MKDFTGPRLWHLPCKSPSSFYHPRGDFHLKDQRHLHILCLIQCLDLASTQKPEFVYFLFAFISLCTYFWPSAYQIVNSCKVIQEPVDRVGREVLAPATQDAKPWWTGSEVITSRQGKPPFLSNVNSYGTAPVHRLASGAREPPEGVKDLLPFPKGSLVYSPLSQVTAFSNSALHAAVAFLFLNFILRMRYFSSLFDVSKHLLLCA